MQEGKLQELLGYLNRNPPFYKELFSASHVNIAGIKTWKTLHISLPPASETLGSPVAIALSENDLNRLAYNEYASFLGAGGSRDEIYQLMLMLDCENPAGTGLRHQCKMIVALFCVGVSRRGHSAFVERAVKTPPGRRYTVKPRRMLTLLIQ